MTTESVSALADLESEVDYSVSRFRPSMLVTVGHGGGGFPEDGWDGSTFECGDLRFEVTGPTPRCVMTTVAQPGIEQDRGVLQSLATHRRLDTVLGPVACLGSYAEVTASGTLTTGDTFSTI